MATTETPSMQRELPGTGSRGGGRKRVCLIDIAGEQLVLDLKYVREVFVLTGITPVPGMPAVLKGVVQLRGTVMPLVDLRTVVGHVAAEPPSKFAIVLHYEEHQIALMVEKVPEILTVDAEDFQHAPGQEAGVVGRMFQTMLKVGERFYSVAELGTILKTVEMG